MLFRNKFNNFSNNKKDESLNFEKTFFLILTICLIIIIVINMIQLYDLIETLDDVNATLKTLSTTSQNYELQQELKTSYTIQLVKAICVLIAEFAGAALCCWWYIKKFFEKKPN